MYTNWLEFYAILYVHGKTIVHKYTFLDHHSSYGIVLWDLP